MMAGFTARSERLRLLTPRQLQLAEIWPGRSAVGIICFDYVRSDIGPYGEVAVAWPVVHAHRPPPPLLPILAETRWPGMGWWVHRLPVTSPIANEAGRAHWGYPKFVADIEFGWDGSRRSCTLSEGGAEILRLTIDTRMAAVPRRFPLRTWSQQGGELLHTTVDVDAVGLRRMMRADVELALGPHPVGRELEELGLDRSRAVEVRWFPVWRAVLPAADTRVRVAPPAEASGAA